MKWRKCAEPGRSLTSLVLVHYNQLDNQYQQSSESLYTFTPSKSYAYLLNIEPSNLTSSKNFNTEFDEIITTFTGKNGRPSKIED